MTIEIGEPINLQEALVKQLARMRDEVIPAYESIGAAGTFALHLIREDVRRADKALADGDAIAMLRAFGSLSVIET